MKLIVLSGFLGSGKTSFLLQLAKHLTETTGNEKMPKVAIIENEIGATSVDGKIIANRGLEIRELLAGCVCCSLSDNLMFGIEELRVTYEPDWLIIEATGMASAAQIKDALIPHKEWYTSLLLLVLIDAGRFLELFRSIEPMMHRQLEEIDTVILNKIDLVDDETRQEVRDILSEAQPEASLLETVATADIPDEFWAELLGGLA